MAHAVTSLACIPVRTRPDEASEMSSQLLFGEAVTVVGENRYFWEIACAHDGYHGWIDRRQATPVDSPAVALRYVADTTAIVRGGANALTLVRGCRVPADLAGVQGTVEPVGTVDAVTLALRYLGTPYLWGGRSPFGIDCSGLVQVAFGLAGVPLPRDSRDQARRGQPVGSIADVRRGDLVACDAVSVGSHIGIALGDGEILHASARVRIDRLTPSGIVSAETGELTHRLGAIRRVPLLSE